jgi:predicted kinase
MHINPDHFLNVDGARVITAERNAAAWQQCFDLLPRALEEARPDGRLYVLVGPQGSGKSTWAAARKADEPRSVVFDAILVRKVERAPILAAAARSGVEAVAVWFRAPLDECLARNAARPPDQVVPERNIRNVHAAVEPPVLDEGFSEIVVVEHHAD